MPTKSRQYAGNPWKGRIPLGGGKVKTASFPTYREAAAWEKATRGKLGLHTLSLIAKHYLTYCEGRLAPATMEMKRAALDRFIDRCGHMALTEITSYMIAKHVHELYTSRTAIVANKDLMHIRAMWNWSQRWFAVKENPLTVIRPYPVNRRQQYTPPPSEVGRVMDVADAEGKLILTLYCTTGARTHELFELKWDHVDWKLNQVCIGNWKTRGKGVKWTWLPLHKDAKEMLLKRYNDPHRVQYSECPYVFTKPNSSWETLPNGKMRRRRGPGVRKWTRDEVAELLPRLVKKAGVRPFTYRSLRRLYASLLIEHGASLTTVSRLLRHESIAMTEAYIRTINHDLLNYVNAINIYGTPPDAPEERNSTEEQDYPQANVIPFRR